MNAPIYILVFAGDVRAGLDRNTVMNSFASHFGVSAEDAERIFNHPHVVLKRGLDLHATEALCQRLTTLGMIVRMEQMASEISPGVTATTAPVTAAMPITAAAAPLAPPLRANPAPAATAQVKRENFIFSGNGNEFFRIWIVNLLLSVLTLGIYSAWAKVRTQRYFYGNTQLAGSSFEYLASPIAILKGRLIAVAFFAAYSVAGKTSPVVAGLLAVLLMIATPWIIVTSLRFRHRNSAWRGVRFDFVGKPKDAIREFILWPLAGVLSVGLAMPYVIGRQQRWRAGESRFGTSAFSLSATTLSFYMLALAVVAVTIAGVVAGLGVASIVAGASALIGVHRGAFFTLMGIAPVALAYFAAFVVARFKWTNLIYQHLELGPHRFGADYRFGSYLRLVLFNTLGILFTLGLFYPWAKVRSARYAADHIWMEAEGNLEDFAAGPAQQTGATGSEMGDFFNIEIGL
ncbi:MAG: YjgN family protein [Candidatus Nitrotoga sp.]